MGLIQAIVNDKIVNIRTMEITDLYPVDWFNVTSYTAGDGSIYNRRSEQIYPNANRSSLSSGPNDKKGASIVYNAAFNKTIPALTDSDFPQVNFKTDTINATNLIDLIDNEANTITKFNFSNNCYLEIIIGNIGSGGNAGYRIQGSNTNNGINITETSALCLKTFTFDNIINADVFDNPEMFIIEINGEICGIAEVRKQGSYTNTNLPNVYPVLNMVLAFTISDNFISFFSDIPIINDSNELGGTTGEYNFGDGDFDRSSDFIEVPELPSLKATDCGFVTLYSPGRNTLLQFCQYLWSDNLWSAVQKWFADPAEIIVGLGIVPIRVDTDGTFYHKVGTVQFPVPMPLVKSQYQEFDCGELELKPFWGSALDYSPYTQVQIYLPYIGVRELNTDEIMGKKIGIKYHIDLYGGGIVAFVTVDGSVRYQYSGNCMQQIPVSGTNYSEMISNLVQLACVVGTGLAASGAGAQAVADKAAEEANIATAPYGDSDYVVSASNWLNNSGKNKLINCTVSTIMSNKPRVERTGTLGAVTGQMSVQKPFLIITRPEQALPENYKHYNGYPSNITSRLGDLRGYTEVENIRLNNIPATQPEIIEIYDLLSKGVII